MNADEDRVDVDVWNEGEEDDAAIYMVGTAGFEPTTSTV